MNKDARTIINSINSNEGIILGSREQIEKISKSKTDSMKIILDKKPGVNDNNMYDHYTLYCGKRLANLLISIIKQDCIDVIERCEEENINLLKELKQLEIE